MTGGPAGGRNPTALRGARRQAPLTIAWADPPSGEPARGTDCCLGDPPIVLRGGVPLPRRLRPAAELTVVNGISWFPGQHVSRSRPAKLLSPGMICHRRPGQTVPHRL
jgi:hypothetical protein